MSTDNEKQPTRVLATANPVGEVRSRWSWTESRVWTDRMLTALEEGVRGGIWYSLIDKVWSKKNLFASCVKVLANRGASGVDHVSVEDFQRDLAGNINRLEDVLRGSSYRPQSIRRVYIPKPGSNERRPLGIPTVRDRVVQGAIRHVIEPIFEKEFAEHSYGFRPGRGCKDALRRVDELLRAGYHYVVDADLKSYFDTIPHDRLMERLQERIADQRLLELVLAFLKAGIFEGDQEWEPEAGAPQGAVLSPLLSNIYLNPLDHKMSQNGYEMVRYADDFVILCRSRAEAEQALTIVRQWCEAEQLQLHPDKTKIVSVLEEGFDFLGYHFWTTQKGHLACRPREKSLDKLKDSIRAKTKRNNGHNLEAILANLNQTLRGWFGYFQQSTRSTFERLDSWIRRRLRSILRRRLGKRGRGRGRDHQLWPNAYFTKHGFYSLEEAYDKVGQSRFG